MIKTAFAYMAFPPKICTLQCKVMQQRCWRCEKLGSGKQRCQRNVSGHAATCRLQRFNLQPVSRTFFSFSQLLCDGPITAYSFLIFCSRCSVLEALCCFDHPPVRCCWSRLSVTVNPVIISPGYLLYVCWLSPAIGDVFVAGVILHLHCGPFIWVSCDVIWCWARHAAPEKHHGIIIAAIYLVSFGGLH